MDFAVEKQSSSSKYSPLQALEGLDLMGVAAQAQAAELAPALKAGGAANARAGNAAEIAAAGTASGGQEIPYRQEMEASFGADFSNVQAHFGDSAAQASQALGAKAYAMGNQVAFADPNPSKALVAHELTHVLQQSSGPQRKATDGAVDTAGEAQAEAVEAAVAAGRSARSALGNGVQDLPFAPALKDADPGKIGVTQSFSSSGFTAGKSYSLWKGTKYPMGMIGPVRFVARPSASIFWNNKILWDPGFQTSIGVKGDLGIKGFAGLWEDVAELYGELVGSAVGAGSLKVQQGGGCDVKLDVSFKGRLSAGIKLLGVLNKRADLVSETIGSFVGLQWNENGLTAGEWRWGPAIQEYIDWAERQVEMARAAVKVAGASAVLLMRAAELHEKANGAINNPDRFFRDLWRAMPENPVNDEGGMFDWIQMPSWPTLPAPDVGNLLEKLIRLGGNQITRFW
jgi:hypothetical protein